MFLFNHWGEIGQDATHKTGWKENFRIQRFTAQAKKTAVAEFKKWFQKKTGNEWDNRHNFKQRPGMYSFVELSTKSPDSGRGKGRGALCLLL